jgi:hypothetical protein
MYSEDPDNIERRTSNAEHRTPNQDGLPFDVPRSTFEVRRS